MSDNAGRTCILCDGKYEFASEYAHGLVFPRWGDATSRDVFICWECCRYLFDRLSAHFSSIAYGALFNKRNPVRPTRFLPWLEDTVKTAPPLDRRVTCPNCGKEISDEEFSVNSGYNGTLDIGYWCPDCNLEVYLYAVKQAGMDANKMCLFKGKNNE